MEIVLENELVNHRHLQTRQEEPIAQRLSEEDAIHQILNFLSENTIVMNK